MQRSQDQSSADRAKKVLEYLGSDCISLPYLDEGDVRDILLHIRKLHGEAYQWEPTIDVSQFIRWDARLRSKIRGLVTALDLRYLYGRDVKIRIGSLDEGTIGEDEAFFNEGEQQQLT